MWALTLALDLLLLRLSRTVTSTAADFATLWGDCVEVDARIGAAFVALRWTKRTGGRLLLATLVAKTIGFDVPLTRRQSHINLQII
jgi:hypothetical protein